MKLPVNLADCQEWTLIGPMGPVLPEFLSVHPLLAVDGGANFTERMDIWIGDGDSFTQEIKCETIFRFSPQKSHSDLALALTLFSQDSNLTLHAWGFLGGRKDHELLNLGEVFHFLSSKKQSKVIFYDSVSKKITHEILSQGIWSYNKEALFSLAAVVPQKIRILGNCDYPLNDETLLPPLSSLGLSNFSRGEFTLHTSGPLMILFPESDS